MSNEKQKNGIPTPQERAELPYDAMVPGSVAASQAVADYHRLEKLLQVRKAAWAADRAKQEAAAANARYQLAETVAQLEALDLRELFELPVNGPIDLDKLIADERKKIGK